MVYPKKRVAPAANNGSSRSRNGPCKKSKPASKESPRVLPLILPKVAEAMTASPTVQSGRATASSNGGTRTPRLPSASATTAAAAAAAAQTVFLYCLRLVLAHGEYTPSICAWRPHGQAFRIFLPQVFGKRICPQYFGYEGMDKFQQDLKLYGFIKQTTGKGPERNAYYHPTFRREEDPHSENLADSAATMTSSVMDATLYSNINHNHSHSHSHRQDTNTNNNKTTVLDIVEKYLQGPHSSLSMMTPSTLGGRSSHQRHCHNHHQYHQDAYEALVRTYQASTAGNPTMHDLTPHGLTATSCKNSTSSRATAATGDQELMVTATREAQQQHQDQLFNKDSQSLHLLQGLPHQEKQVAVLRKCFVQAWLDSNLQQQQQQEQQQKQEEENCQRPVESSTCLL